MTDNPDTEAVNVVVPLRTPARAAWEASRELCRSFSGWHIWYSVWSASWNAHRKEQEPYFGHVSDGAPLFMVSASSATQLAASLEWQTLGDMAREFPAWRFGRTDSGGWYALNRGQCSVRVVQASVPASLVETVRALARYR